MLKNRNAVVVTRWTDRLPHNNYKRTVRDAAKWIGTGSRLFVAVHGGTDIDPALKHAVDCETLTLLDFRGRWKEPFFPRIVKATFDYVLDQLPDYELVTLLDDDGCYTKPDYASARILAAYDEHGYGAYGPMSPYLAWATYESKGTKVGESHMPIRPQNWTTYGSQTFSTKFLRESREEWDMVMAAVKYRIDVEMFMLAHKHGYGMCEMLMSFNHTCSHASNYIEDLPAWRKRRVDQIDHDYSGMIEVFQKVAPQYVPSLLFLADKDMRMMQARYEKLVKQREGEGVK